MSAEGTGREPEQTGEHNTLLYPAIELMQSWGRLGHSMLEATLAPSIAAWNLTEEVTQQAGLDIPAVGFSKRALEATLEISGQLTDKQPKPEFGLHSTSVGGKEVAVQERVVYETPFCQVVNFERQFENEADRRDDPNVLLFSALSGHHATLHRETVKAQLPNANVSIVVWKYPEDVPAEAGPFGLHEYIDHAVDIIEDSGPDTHVVAICQPTVPVLAALSVIAAERPDRQPLSVVLMGGPIDVEAAESKVTDFVDKNDTDTLRRTVVGEVTPGHPGAGRSVYPAEMQKIAFLMMNPMNHVNAHIDQFWHRVLGNHDKADKSRDFYKEYFAMYSLFGEFYLDTFDMVFDEPQLARGTMQHRGKPVKPSDITSPFLMTVEGSEDDISPVGHTTAAHDLCSSIPGEQQFYHLEPGAGHYGIFSGSKYRENIAPRLRGFFAEAAAARGIKYSEPTSNVIAPDRWSVDT